MKKDIPIPEVKNIGVAIAKEDVEGESEWNAYLINFKDVTIKNVFVTTKGYGTLSNKKVTTATFSHFIEEMPAHSFKKLEPLSEEVFGLSNEFFVTFYEEKLIHDQKFIFVPESIKEEYFTKVKILNKEGVLIKT